MDFPDWLEFNNRNLVGHRKKFTTARVLCFSEELVKFLLAKCNIQRGDAVAHRPGASWKVTGFQPSAHVPTR